MSVYPSESLYPSDSLYLASTPISSAGNGDGQLLFPTATRLLPILLNRFAPWLTSQTDPSGDHLNYVTALAAMGEQVTQLVMDAGDPDDPAYVPGWGVLYDIDKCPYQFLPYLSQLVGVKLPSGLSDTAARSLIRSEQGQSRGTPGSIIAAAKRFLTGTQSVDLIERQGLTGPDPYAFLLVVNPSELSMGATWAAETTPWSSTSETWSGTDQTIALTNAVNAIKPAGVRWSLVESSGHIWSSATKTWSQETVSWQSADVQTV